METDFAVPFRLSLDVPHLSDYFGLWAVYADPFRSVVERCNGLNLHAHINSEAAIKAVEANNAIEYEVTKDGIAKFYVQGPMMKSVSSLSGGTSTVRLRQQIRSARKDPEVVGGIMVMDTPGGTVRGNRDLANEVTSFASSKPLFVYVEDMTASAGVSIASQATKRFANNTTALYGAMGTYSVIWDYSGQADKLGVKVHVIKAGDFKGMGEPGTPISEEQIAELQRIVNSLNDQYIETIASGLSKPVATIRGLADGRIHPAADALAFGLIDGIQSYEQTYRQLVELAGRQKSPSSQRRNSMEKTPATLAELKAAFPNSTAEWRESQMEAGASLNEAALTYAKFVEAKAATEKADMQKQLDEATAKTKAPKAGLGHQPLLEKGGDEGYQSETGDPLQDFDSAVRARLPRNATPTLEQRQAAIAYVARTRPDLHQAMLIVTNRGSRSERLIKEKYEQVAGS